MGPLLREQIEARKLGIAIVCILGAIASAFMAGHACGVSP